MMKFISNCPFLWQKTWQSVLLFENFVFHLKLQTLIWPLDLLHECGSDKRGGGGQDPEIRNFAFLGDFIKRDTEPRCRTCRSPIPTESKPTQHKNPKGEVVNGNVSKMIRFTRGDLATSEASPTTLVSASLRDRVKHVEKFQDERGLWQKGQCGVGGRSAVKMKLTPCVGAKSIEALK